MRWTCKAFVVSLWLPLAAAAGEALPKPPFVGEVTGEGIYVRAGDGINYTAIAVAEKGERLEVKGERFGWLRIPVPENCTLWVHKKLLSPDADGKLAMVARDRVNVRARPKPEADVMGQLAKGTRVTLVDEDGDWLGIAPTEAASAWVRSGFVRKATGEVAKPPKGKAPPEMGATETAALLGKAQELFRAELAKPAAKRDFAGVLAAYQKVASKSEDTAVGRRAERARQRLLKIVDLHDALRGARETHEQFDKKYEALEAEYKRRAEEAGKREPE